MTDEKADEIIAQLKMLNQNINSLIRAVAGAGSSVASNIRRK